MSSTGLLTLHFKTFHSPTGLLRWRPIYSAHSLPLVRPTLGIHIASTRAAVTSLNARWLKNSNYFGTQNLNERLPKAISRWKWCVCFCRLMTKQMNRKSPQLVLSCLLSDLWRIGAQQTECSDWSQCKHLHVNMNTIQKKRLLPLEQATRLIKLFL